MKFDYIYGNEKVCDFPSFNIPRELFTSKFNDISTSAKLLYGVIYCDSEKTEEISNNVDINEVMDILNCDRRKAKKVLDEIDEITKRGV